MVLARVANVLHVVVASTNPVKVNAARNAFQRCLPKAEIMVQGVNKHLMPFFESWLRFCLQSLRWDTSTVVTTVIPWMDAGIPVQSGVPDQPMGDAETLRGSALIFICMQILLLRSWNAFAWWWSFDFLLFEVFHRRWRCRCLYTSPVPTRNDLLISSDHILEWHGQQNCLSKMHGNKTVKTVSHVFHMFCPALSPALCVPLLFGLPVCCGLCPLRIWCAWHIFLSCPVVIHANICRNRTDAQLIEAQIRESGQSSHRKLQRIVVRFICV